MDIEDFIQIVKKAFEKQSENKAWELYLTRYANMTEEDYIPFDEFYKPQVNQEIENKSEADILAEVKQILDSL